MIYLDYSATTKPNRAVLEYFNLVSIKYFANANSIYSIGRNSKKAIKRASEQLLNTLGFDNHEIIYTSCATEANNLAIKGAVEALKGSKNRIITNLFEHSSVVAPINILQKKGIKVSIVHHDENGRVDLEHLKSLMGADVALVSIGSVDSEIGIRQPLSEIAKIVHEGGSILHCDATQSIGKEVLGLREADLVTFSAHKFYGIKGIGALVKRKDVALTAQLHGGTSTTIYRAGTPNTPLILSLKKAVTIIYKNHAKKYAKVKLLNMYLRGLLDQLPYIVINSPKDALPHILNFSVMGISSHKLINLLSKKEIFLSNHSACSSNSEKSLAVLALTNDEKRAQSSIRVSISHLTTKYELDVLIKELKKIGKAI
ncbi:MAG: cysteine desulfurase family protein [Bacilli bacterium]|nr:cysteine desulfurase family protein [Bacilli bacterium]